MTDGFVASGALKSDCNRNIFFFTAGFQSVSFAFTP